MKQVIRIGSRDSLLAVAQTKLVMEQIQRCNPDLRLELVTMKTTGDRILNKSLDQVGGKGLFVKELDDALLEEKVDLTIHSLKDVPMEINPDLPLVAMPQRGDPRDALVLPEKQEFSCTEEKIGTSSLRRKLQLTKLYDQPGFDLVRGNIITRLNKLDAGNYSALVLAAAGLERVGLGHRISRLFDPVDEMIPPAGQAILAVQGRKGEDYSFLEPVNDPVSQIMAQAERGFVTALNGGCSSPVAAYAQVHRTEVKLTGLYYDEPSGEYSIDCITGSTEEAQKLGIALAEKMKQEWK
ncbi:MAG: hydroxymethylbilane synthase [Massiliimalia sp.]|jgi:hydroxymethylbilane synthase